MRLTFLSPNRWSKSITAQFLGWKNNFGCQFRADWAWDVAYLSLSKWVVQIYRCSVPWLKEWLRASISCGWIGHEIWLTFLRSNWRSESVAARFFGWKNNFRCQFHADGLDMRRGLLFFTPIGGPNLSLLGSLTGKIISDVNFMRTDWTWDVAYFSSPQLEVRIYPCSVPWLEK